MLGGWHKNQLASLRRKNALSSRPKGWSLKKKSLSAARALTALANVTKDPQTKKIAKSDATYLYQLAKKD